MRPFGQRRVSVKKRLLLTLLLPLGVILLALGLSGAWLIDRVIENTSDRVLSGSLQAIAETLAVQKGYLTLDLPPSALGMLVNADRDNVYYSVSYRGKLITGYPELAVEMARVGASGDIGFRYGWFHGTSIRVAAEEKLVPQLDAPVLVQVAETTKNRVALAHRMLESLIAAELFLLLTIAVLVFFAVDWSLRPLTLLRKEIQDRNDDIELNVSPLSLEVVPQEALPLVSAFNALLGHVDTAFDTLKRFTSDASHQLRAPLAVVRTHVELLERHLADKADARDAISDISHAVRALQHLIVQLISLARAEQPRGDIGDVASFDLVACAAATARNLAASALAKHIDLGLEAECDSLAVAGNAIYAGEIVANLLDNAIGYGRPGGHVTVRISKTGLLEIEDDGPGVAVRDRARIFERFYRLPNAAGREGSGLGLSIVQALARRMGAVVDLQTPASGKGLTIRVRFRLMIGQSLAPPRGEARF
jgi:two-component system sensor histidine kinase TctE